MATVSCVAMQINYPLMALCPEESFKDRCSALLEAIELLPSTIEKYIVPVEDKAIGKRQAEAEARRAAVLLPVSVTLLVPDHDNLVVRRGLEMPGVKTVKVELPPASTIADLKAAALQMCGGHTFGDR